MQANLRKITNFLSSEISSCKLPEIKSMKQWVKGGTIINILYTNIKAMVSSCKNIIQGTQFLRDNLGCRIEICW